MTKDTGKINPEKNNKKRGQIPLVQIVGGEGKMKPEWIVPESSLVGTGLEGPGQLRLPSRGMQQTAVGSCTYVDGSLQLGGEFSFFELLSG